MLDGVRLKDTETNQKERAPVAPRLFFRCVVIAPEVVLMAPGRKEGKVGIANMTLLDADDVRFTIVKKEIAQLRSCAPRVPAKQSTGIPGSNGDRTRSSLPLAPPAHVRRGPPRRR